jgi:hypothetical protein
LLKKFGYLPYLASSAPFLSCFDKRKGLSCYLHTGDNIKFILRLLYYIYYTYFKSPSFFVKYFKKTKSPSAKGQRAGNCQAPRVGV